jgi:hypothetical protein
MAILIRVSSVSVIAVHVAFREHENEASVTCARCFSPSRTWVCVVRVGVLRVLGPDDLLTCTRLGSFFPTRREGPQRRGSGPRHEALPLEFSGAMSASYYVAHAELLG